MRKVGFVKKVERPFCYINVLIKVDICTKIGLDEYIKNLDKEYDTKLDEPNINSIIKQLLSIARILIKNSKIMLFDESIDILDIKTRKKIISLLKELSRDHTIIISTHDNDIVDMADNIINLD
ncbi:MAG TPA: ABC transporter ATP-binding protein [Mollicutes bacterium]|nr:ABC transporter ATP-binding protein [Mollicutes bacterium]